MQNNRLPNSSLVLWRQMQVVGAFLILIGFIVLIMYWKDRQQEWRLREEQATHRLELAYELITRDLERVRSDILYAASQASIRQFDAGDESSRLRVENEFASFLRIKGTYQQIRLIDINGHESVRVDLQGTSVHVVPEQQLQDKKDRYYVRESIRLRPGDVFVSEFDLNQEYGVIERPLNPVIRFVTPVENDTGHVQYLLVANYRGAPLLNELAGISLPGETFVIRDDGQFLLGPRSDDAWGWLLNHPRSFVKQFGAVWNQGKGQQGSCLLTQDGLFAFREIQLDRFGRVSNDNQPLKKQLLIVSHLSAARVFETSSQLLSRMLILVSVILLPLFVLTRFWAVASLRRRQQTVLILESEKKLRELSSRLVKIQEDERKAISREIHDQLGQQVTAINLDLKLAERATESGNVREQLRRAIDESELLLDALHDFATRIRPVELDDLGLHDAVESFLWEFKQRTGIEFGIESDLEDIDLPPSIAENVYRLIQESINNVMKHADATRVDVSIKRSDSDPAVLIVCVKDDGVGAPESLEHWEKNGKATDGNPRLGILGMRERVDLLGGSFELVTQANRGTSVNVVIPFEGPRNADSGNV